MIQLQTADGQVLSVTTASVADAAEGDLLGDTGGGGGGSAGVSGAVVRSGVDVSDISGLDNIWSAGDNALRDFLVYLVRKHHIDEVYDSKVGFCLLFLPQIQAITYFTMSACRSHY